MVEVLVKDQFVNALPEEDMQLRIRQNRPAMLRAALELESYQLASREPGLYVKCSWRTTLHYNRGCQA